MHNLAIGNKLDKVGRVLASLGNTNGDWEVTWMATKEFLNVRETAEQLGVHENTVRNWESSGVLRGIRLPGSGFRRFPRDEVERMRSEMLGSYAPATELPPVTTGAKTRLVDGDSL
jgi:excisionase family DNA binding protein